MEQANAIFSFLHGCHVLTLNWDWAYRSKFKRFIYNLLQELNQELYKSGDGMLAWTKKSKEESLNYSKQILLSHLTYSRTKLGWQAQLAAEETVKGQSDFFGWWEAEN